MKKLVVTLFLCGITLVIKAQDASVEKSIFGVQTGLFGVWVHNEVRLSDKFVLRCEIGLDSGIHNDDFLMAPGISVEPKFYYNLNKRLSKSKEITGNSGNFLSLKTSFHPDWFIISESDNYNVSNQISIVPTWGMRRNIGKHFNYELGFGIGWLHEFAETINNFKFEANNEAAINLHTRIGYRF
ncbi:hypothetical protein [Lutibacter agarilyticus]|nr:hypothetical protein [Lutibacter agarilyticus]